MERSWIGLTLLVTLGAFGLGCGTPCENARARIDARYAECQITVEDPEAQSEVCSATEGEYMSCVADCTDSATCEALDNSDPQGAEDFATCFADCSR